MHDKPRSSVSEPPMFETQKDLIESSFFEEEEVNDIGKKQWEDFLQMQNNERTQPEQHENMKNVCLKIFPKLALQTNLSAEELQVYYAIRFKYICSYSE